MSELGDLLFPEVSFLDVPAEVHSLVAEPHNNRHRVLQTLHLLDSCIVHVLFHVQQLANSTLNLGLGAVSNQRVVDMIGR